MSTEVVMPQMGESIADGTITKWLKKVGERVERDEPLFEISTDKVDAEIPSPAAGTLTEIRFNEGDTVEINTTVAVLDGGATATAAPASAPAETETKKAQPEQKQSETASAKAQEAETQPAQSAPVTPAAPPQSALQATAAPITQKAEQPARTAPAAPPSSQATGNGRSGAPPAE